MILRTYRTENDWLAARRRGLTSSETPLLFGVGYAGSNVYSLYYSKVFDEEPPWNKGNRRMFDFGHHMESLLHRWTEEDLGVTLTDPGDYAIAHYEGGLPLLATPDRLIYSEGSAEPDTMIEFKAITYGARKYMSSKRWTATRIQAQQAMMCTGTRQGMVGLFFPPSDFRLIPVTRSVALEEQILERATEFWGFVEAREVPPKEFIDDTEEVGKALAAIYDTDDGSEKVLGAEWGRVLDRLAEIKDNRSELESEERFLKHLAMRELGPATSGIVPGHERRFKFEEKAGGGFEIKPWRRRILSDVRA